MEIISWQTFKKKNNPPVYTVQDGTLGIVYSVEPTLLKFGFIRGGIINKTVSITNLSPLTIRFTPKEEVKEWISKNEWCSNYKKCVYYSFRVRQECATHIVEVYFQN